MTARLVAVALVVFSGCAGADDPEPTGTTERDTGIELVNAVEGVCAASRAALESAHNAETIFVDRAHHGIIGLRMRSDL